LSRFVAACEKHDQNAGALHVVHAVAWTDVDLQLTNAVGQDTMLTRIAVSQAIDSHLNSGPTDPVSQTIDPFAIDLGDLNAHSLTVSYRIRTSTVAAGAGSAETRERHHHKANAAVATEPRARTSLPRQHSAYQRSSYIDFILAGQGSIPPAFTNSARRDFIPARHPSGARVEHPPALRGPLSLTRLLDQPTADELVQDARDQRLIGQALLRRTCLESFKHGTCKADVQPMVLQRRTGC